jgi:hypothetical protein
VLRPLWFDAHVACLRKGCWALTLCWPVKNLRAIGRTTLSRSDALGADVAYARDGVLACTACMVPEQAISIAAWTCTIAVAVSSIVIAGVTLVTPTAAVSATAMVASRVPAGVSAMARFCDGERSGEMGQDCVTEIKVEDHRTAHGNH